MAYTVQNLKTDLEGMLHGTSIDQVTNQLALINRGTKDLLLEIDPMETKRKAQITNAIYDDVYNYSAPADLKGNKIIDIRPQVRRTPGDNISTTYSEQFDLYKGLKPNMVHVEYDGGTKFLRIDIPLTGGETLHTMTSITGNGTWAVGDDATNLTADTLDYVSGSASLNFDVDGNTTAGYIENSTMTAVDLSDEDEKSSLFLWLYIPDSTAFTSCNLRWGNDTSNYWSRTVTAPHYGSFANGWNLLRFDWNGATETGTVAPASIDYLRVTVNYDGTADTDFRVDNIVSRLGTIHEIVYYSNYIFKDGTTSAQKEDAENDADTIILDPDARNLLLYKIAYLGAQQIQGQDSGFDVSFFGAEYEKLKRRYKSLYKSEVEKPRQQYYRTPRPSQSAKPFLD